MVPLRLASRSIAVLQKEDEVSTEFGHASTSSADSLRLDEMGNIGNMDTNFKRAVIEFVDVQCIIEVTSSIRIDSEDPALSEVLSRVNLSLRNGPWRRRETLCDIIGESASDPRLVSPFAKETETKGSTHVSSVKPQSFSRALLSASRLPISPSSSTSDPKGCRDVIGHRLMHATKSVLT